MKTLKDFTPEIQAKIPEYQNRVLEPIFNGSKYHNFDIEKAKKAIKWNYEKCGYKMPIVLVAENPLEQQYLFNYLKLNIKKYEKTLYVLNNEFVEIKINDIKCKISSYFILFFNFTNLSIDNQLRSQLDSQLSSQLDSQLSSQLDSQLRSQLDSQLDSQLSSQLYSQLRSQLNSQLSSQLYSQLRSQLRSQLDSQLSSQLDSQLDSQLSSQLYSQLRSQLYSQLDSQLRSQLDSQLSSQLDSQLNNQLYNQLNSQLRNELKKCKLKDLSKYNPNYLFTLNIYSEVYYTWFEFIRKEFDLPLTINDDFQECFKLHSESNIYSAIFSKEVCVISKYPLEIHQEKTQFRLNNIEKSAVIWSNSFAPFDCYYVNGLNISKDLFEKLSKKEVTFEDWMKEPNEEIKAAILSFYQQKFGDEYLFQFLSKNLKEIDTFVDKKDSKYLERTTKGMNIGVYTLFKGNVNDVDIAYIRCYCPSTDRMFFLGVNPENTNAKDAIASLYQVPRKLKDEIVSIQRQGEIFSTNFTENGLFLLKEMKQEDIQDMTSISGNDYFKLIKYEY